ncbi:MAG: alpha/beta hydrolase [Clostridia bacterium]|nr:alpha/beta hydrolase [Clostridia bacterium]
MFYKDIPFKFCGSVSVLLDLWTPSEETSAAGWPLVIFYHGGGFCFGDKNNSSAAERWRDMLLAKGVAFASAGYRHGGYGGALQAVASDGADAVRFFGKNGAKYGIDGSRILLAGHSAGGQVAMLVGLAGENFRDNWSDKETQCRVLGVVSLAGTPTMQFGRYINPPFNPGLVGGLRSLLGENWADPAVAAEAEPQSYVERGEAERIPVLCVQPQADQLIPPGMAVDFCRVGTELGYDFRHLPLADTGHCLENPGKGGISEASLAADKVICDFVLEVLNIEI